MVEFYLRRCQGNLAMIDKFNLVGRTSELARLYGIEFYNVLSRGTQVRKVTTNVLPLIAWLLNGLLCCFVVSPIFVKYRVESMMLRLAKPANFIPISPNVHQRAR